MSIAIRNCKLGHKCDRKWDDLTDTKTTEIRFCMACQREVYLCRSKEQLVDAIALNRCVAIINGEIKNIPPSGGKPLFKALKAKRLELARDLKVPAYVIFHDSTLLEIEDHRPITHGEMKNISGVGQTKLAAYGEEFLQVVRDYFTSTSSDEVTEIIQSNPDVVIPETDNSETVPVEDWEAVMLMTIEDSKHYVSSKEESKYYIGEISLLQDYIKDNAQLLAESSRCILELKEKALKLPTQESVDGLIEKRRKEKELEKNAPLCRKHEIPMILHEGGQDGYFWSCKNFSLPNNDINKCYITKRLLKAEKQIVE